MGVLSLKFENHCIRPSRKLHIIQGQPEACDVPNRTLNNSKELMLDLGF